jgi:Tol biopolymer transport system component
MDADGQRPFLLTVDDQGATDLSPRFTPQGNFVLFISNRDIGRFALFLVDLRGEQVIPVTVNMNFVDSLTFQPE